MTLPPTLRLLAIPTPPLTITEPVVVDVDCVVSVTLKIPPIVTATPVIMLSVPPIPVKEDPSPEKLVAVTIPV